MKGAKTVVFADFRPTWKRPKTEGPNGKRERRWLREKRQSEGTKKIRIQQERFEGGARINTMASTTNGGGVRVQCHLRPPQRASSGKRTKADTRRERPEMAILGCGGLFCLLGIKKKSTRAGTRSRGVNALLDRQKKGSFAHRRPGRSYTGQGGGQQTPSFTFLKNERCNRLRGKPTKRAGELHGSRGRTGNVAGRTGSILKRRDRSGEEKQPCPGSSPTTERQTSSAAQG